jgi:mono/diheme cytochrome c family protein
MRKTSLALALALAACAARSSLPRSPAADAVVEVRGDVKGGPFPLSAGDLERLPRAAVRGVDPRGGREAAWQGVRLAELVNGRVERTHNADTVVVRTSDREAVPIPIPLARQLRPVLADQADGERLPGLVLAWPNVEQAGLTTDPREPLWWAHGVVALEVVEWQRTFGRALAPPDGASDGARVGAELYLQRCVACHRIRGQGGEKGPDLTRAVAGMTRDAFHRRLGGHPGWTAAGQETPGADSAAQLWAFLKVVSVAPAPEPHEEPPPRREDEGRRRR